MLAGQCTSCPTGDPDDLVLDLDLAPYANGEGAVGTVRMIDGAGDKYYVVVCDELPQSIVYVDEGLATPISVMYDAERAAHAVSLVPLGDWPSWYGSDPTIQQRLFTEDKGKSLWINWDALITGAKAWGESGAFSAISFTGIARYSTCAPVAGKPLAGRLRFSTSSTGPNRFMQLYLDGEEIYDVVRNVSNKFLFSGHASGIEGEVTCVSYPGDIAYEDGAYLEFTWAKAYELHAQAPALSFPRTADATVPDPGLGAVLSGKIDNLAAGSYEYLVRAITETDVTGTNITPAGTKTVPGRPAPPAALAYLSGDNTNTTIRVTRSPDDDGLGAIGYRLYEAPTLDWSINYRTPADTEGASAGATFDWTLPAIGAAAGTRRISVVAYRIADGVEDGERKRLSLEYSGAGVYLAPRPNVPDFYISARSGRQLTVAVEYLAVNEKASGTYAALYVLAASSAIPADGAAPTVRQVLLTDDAPYKRAQIQYTVASDGLYKVLVRIEAGSGGPQSLNSTPSAAEELASAVPPAPDNVGATVTT